MADNSKESKAKKLAAAQKKLKEYQSRRADAIGTSTASIMTTSSTSIPSSEPSENEFSGSTLNLVNETPNITVNNDEATTSSIANYFHTPAKDSAFDININDQSPFQQTTTSLKDTVQANEVFANSEEQAHNTESFQLNEQQQQLNAMQLLINEKTQLTAELNRWRSLCRDKDSTLEELRTQLITRNQEFENVQQNFKQQQQNAEQLRKFNAELMHKLSQANAVQEDQSMHLTELQEQLKLAQSQVSEFEIRLKEKSKECELAQLRIQQISDESNLGKDDRVETLTKNQFMYEQQIRDLQAMVQQFTQDKDQSNAQFQNYVQHLNAQVASLTERNSELTDECTQLQERERQLVEHISELEKEIQKNISLRKTAAENQAPNDNSCSLDEIVDLKKQIETLEERLNELSFERHEFQLKIKSQEDRLEELQKALREKVLELEKVTEIIAEQPDQVKLLATMESDKIAASRALAQNVELKKQLDELELRFVQLTNDKAELTNELDSEKFENREMRGNFAAMEQRLQSLDERFQYKDAEMIRLSHENMELTRKNLVLQQQIDRLKHYEVKEYSNSFKLNNEDFEKEREPSEVEKNENSDDHQHDGRHHHDDDNDHAHDDHHSYVDQHHGHSHHEVNHKNCKHDTENHNTNYSETDSCHEANEAETENSIQKQMAKLKSTVPQNIATEEAVEKLQARFTFLMSQIADLTDEKQRLEHLVLQLQGETETIGEYITLYQTQRRILKQREYEKAAQTRLLQEEREKLREKIAQLNELVSKLGLLEKTTIKTTTTDNTNSYDIKSQLNAALAESVSIEPHEGNEGSTILNENVGDLGPPKISINNKNNALPSEILMQIQNIVTEIKENTTKDVPLFDVTPSNAVEICHCCEGQLKIV